MSVIYFKSRKCWRVKFQQDGKEKYAYFKTEAEARNFEADRIAEKTRQEDRLTLGELVVLFYQNNAEKHSHTKKHVVYFLAGHEDRDGAHVEGAGEFLRDKFAESLTRQDLEQMRAALRARGAGNNTINKYQAYIRAILAWGVDQELIHFNPWRDYKRLKVQRHVFRASFSDFQRILAVSPDWLVWALKTAYALALRPGQVELFSLPWTAFHWRYGFVEVRQGKTGMLKRVVPPALYWQEAQQRHAHDMAKGILLVCHRNGRRVLDYHTAWHKALKAAGLHGTGIRMYDIRHIAASEMLANGADLSAVAAQLGHSSTQTTATTYSHVMPHAQERAANLLPPLTQPGAEK